MSQTKLTVFYVKQFSRRTSVQHDYRSTKFLTAFFFALKMFEKTTYLVEQIIVGFVTSR